MRVHVNTVHVELSEECELCHKVSLVSNIHLKLSGIYIQTSAVKEIYSSTICNVSCLYIGVRYTSNDLGNILHAKKF